MYQLLYRYTLISVVAGVTLGYVDFTTNSSIRKYNGYPECQPLGLSPPETDFLEYILILSCLNVSGHFKNSFTRSTLGKGNYRHTCNTERERERERKSFFKKMNVRCINFCIGILISVVSGYVDVTTNSSIRKYIGYPKCPPLSLSLPETDFHKSLLILSRLNFLVFLKNSIYTLCSDSKYIFMFNPSFLKLRKIGLAD